MCIYIYVCLILCIYIYIHVCFQMETAVLQSGWAPHSNLFISKAHWNLMKKNLANHAVGFKSLYLPLPLLEQLELLEILSSLSLEMILLLCLYSSSSSWATCSEIEASKWSMVSPVKALLAPSSADLLPDPRFSRPQILQNLI